MVAPGLTAHHSGSQICSIIKGLLIFGLSRRPIVLLGLLVFIAAGLFAFSKLNIEAYPNPAPVILEITAKSPVSRRRYTIPLVKIAAVGEGSFRASVHRQ